MLFAISGHEDMVKLLAGQYNAPVNVKSQGGYTPLHLACQYGHQVGPFLYSGLT